jgi:carbon-monoxide dehydrogenase small subunit
MLVSARDIVVRLPDADERDPVAMSGNLCRCTGYVGIVRAVQMTIAERRARGPVSGGGRAELGPVAASGSAMERDAMRASRTPKLSPPRLPRGDRVAIARPELAAAGFA